MKSFCDVTIKLFLPFGGYRGELKDAVISDAVLICDVTKTSYKQVVYSISSSQHELSTLMVREFARKPESSSMENVPCRRLLSYWEV